MLPFGFIFPPYFYVIGHKNLVRSFVIWMRNMSTVNCGWNAEYILSLLLKIVHKIVQTIFTQSLILNEKL